MAVKLSAARVRVLRSIAAGNVIGSCSIYDPRFPKWREEVPGKTRSNDVTAQYHALVGLGLVLDGKPRIGQMVRARVTDAGRVEIERLDGQDAVYPASARCPDCGKTVQIKQDGTFRQHKGRRPYERSRPATECIGSGEKPVDAEREF